MSDDSTGGRSGLEERLDALREEAAATGTIDSRGVRPVGGPIPSVTTTGDGSDAVGYYGRPVLKPPVWTWEIPVYFFVGGIAGTAPVLALGAAVAGAGDLVSAALWVAAVGVLLSAPLLILDLGRPARFLNMLRVFKWRSPMSIGVWTLVLFSLTVLPAALAAHLDLPFLLWTTLPPAAALGLVLATYTGVLLAVTAVPVWAGHRSLLPVHFGTAGLGSAAALLELLGFTTMPLHLVGLLAAAAETVLLVFLELGGDPRRDRPLHAGGTGLLVRTSATLAGPLALLVRLLGLVPAAAGLFLVGSLLSRFAWLAAGRASARDPAAVLDPQRTASPTGAPHG